MMNFYTPITHNYLSHALVAAFFINSVSTAGDMGDVDTSHSVLHYSSKTEEAILLRTSIPDDWGIRGGISSEIVWWRDGRVEKERSFGMLFGVTYCERSRVLFAMKADGIDSIIRNEEIIRVGVASGVEWPLLWAISSDSKLMAVYHHDINLHRGSIVFYGMTLDGKLVQTAMMEVDRRPKAIWLFGDPDRYRLYLESPGELSLTLVEYHRPNNAQGGPFLKRSEIDRERIIGAGARGPLYLDDENRVYKEGLDEALAQFPFSVACAWKEGDIIALISHEGDVYEFKLSDESLRNVARFAENVSSYGLWTRGMYVGTLSHGVYVVVIEDGSVRLASLESEKLENIDP